MEEHVIKMLASKTPGVDFSQLPTLFDGLPVALGKLELEFSALSQGFDVQHHQSGRLTVSDNISSFLGAMTVGVARQIG